MSTPRAPFHMLPTSPPVSALSSFVAENDIWVASWPKSGTTWTQAIVAHLLTPDRCEWAHVSEVTPFFDVAAHFDIQEGRIVGPAPVLGANFKKSGRRAWNTHLLWSLMPRQSASARYVYVVRDGRDAIISFWHHLRNQRGDAGTFEGSLDSFVAQVTSNELPYGSWAAHVADWSKARSDPRVLFVHYDAMKRDLSKVVSDIAAHLELPLTEARCLEIARMCSFAEMRIDHDRYQPISVRWAPGFQFFRKGTSGEGRKYLGRKSLCLLKQDAERHLLQEELSDIESSFLTEVFILVDEDDAEDIT